MNLFNDLPGYSRTDRVKSAIAGFMDWWTDDRPTNALVVVAALLSIYFFIHAGVTIAGMR
jgi:hypothetical protein